MSKRETCPPAAKSGRGVSGTKAFITAQRPPIEALAVLCLAGDVLNTGDRALSGIDATIEFQDDMRQIALRETRPVLFGTRTVLLPGKTAHFQISFDHVPPSWNMQLPSVKVAGLQFAPTGR